MSPKKAWTNEEEMLLVKNYGIVSNKALSDMLGRGINSVEGKAKRMGLRKLDLDSENRGALEEYLNKFEMMTRDEALKLDKIDLLRINWSLFEMYRRELNNPGLTKTQRHKLMNALSSHTAVISGVMKGSEDQLGDEGDLKARFNRLNLGDQRRIDVRRIRLNKRRRYTHVI